MKSEFLKKAVLALGVLAGISAVAKSDPDLPRDFVSTVGGLIASQEEITQRLVDINDRAPTLEELGSLIQNANTTLSSAGQGLINAMK